MSNNGLTVRIPLVSYPQKGSLALSYSVVYSTFGFLDQVQCDAGFDSTGSTGEIPLNSDCTDAIGLAPIGLGSTPTPGPKLVADQILFGGGSSQQEPLQSATPPVDTRLYVIAADNSQTALGATSDGYRSLDESDYLFIPSSPITGAINAYAAVNPGNADPFAPTTQSVNGTVIDSAGRKYTATAITDPDGNQIQIQNGVWSSGLPATDSVGRIIPVPGGGSIAGCPSLSQAQYQPLVSASSWTVPGSGSGGTVSYLFCYAQVNIVTHFFGSGGGPDSQTQEMNSQVSMLQSIVLPNGTHWGFIYDSNNPSTPYGPTGQTAGTGQLTTLIYPTGGSVTYTYGLTNGFCDSFRRSALIPTGMSVQTWLPVIQSRTLLDANQSVVGQWNYTSQGIVSIAGDVVVPRGASVPTNSQCSPNIDAGTDTYSALPSAGGRLLRSTVKTYMTGTIQGFPGASIIREAGSVTTLDDGSTVTIQKSYAPSRAFWATSCDQYGNSCGPGLSYSAAIGKPTSVVYKDYDGSILKQESTTYQWQLDTSDTSYQAGNFLDISASDSILDQNGSPLETTNYTYDETYYSPGGVRGHVTTVAQSLNVNSGPAPVTHTGWNAGGERSFIIDADGNHNSNGHTADYYYDGDTNCNGSEITKSTNALNQSVSATYDCTIGRLTSLTDANGNTTSVAYDSTPRLLSVASPPVAGGTPTTSFTYADSANTVTKTVTASPDPTQTTTVVFDSFGREMQRHGSDPQGGDYVDTAYDADGRVSTVSNPYRIGDTVYLTTTTYDALGRPLSKQLPDLNTQTMSYTGPAVDSYDESGAHMKHVSDALGRLTHVYELGTSASPLNLETDYTYDPLGNLKTVAQLGAAGETARTRSFNYDSLSRLLTSQNPETGTICYGQWSGSNCVNGYDANGNLLYKTDANGTTLSYTYDALNRLTLKTTSPAQQDGEMNQHFTYDQGANGIGRLWQVEDPIWTGTILNGTQFSYDPMGRVSSTQWLNYVTQSWQAGAGALYDLAGNITQITYPDTHIINQTWDGAGRLASVSDGPLNGGGLPYVSGIQYSPSGSMAGATYGNGVSETLMQNTRLQPCRSTATTPLLAANANGGNLLDRQIFYGQIAEPNCGNAANNNGNIWHILENPGSTSSQDFTYDNLNRLVSAHSTNRPAATTYSNTYNMDSFGNMLVQDNLHTPLNYSIDPATNRLLLNVTDLQYDSAGRIVSSPNPLGNPHSMTYTAEGYLRSIDNYQTGSYLYNGLGERTLAVNNIGWHEYVYMNGQPMADVDDTGKWSDYIYANGQKIAKVDSSRPMLHLSGHRDASNYICGTEGDITGTPVYPAGALGYQIAPNDRLVADFKQDQPSNGGIGIIFTDNTGSGYLNDMNTSTPLWFNNVTGTWQHLVGDLTPYAGLTVASGYAGIHQQMPPGDFNMWYVNVAIITADGRTLPITTGQSQSVPNFSGSPCGGSNLASSTDPFVTTGSDSAEGTSYFLDDHLGTTQMELSSGGWPLWQGQFTPFGQEVGITTSVLGQQPADGTSMRYKFTGKERDSESGLDYFGARYYASSMGRWMSPDWADKPEAVPYSSLGDPQSLNLYIYVGNNPLSRADLDGHGWITDHLKALGRGAAKYVHNAAATSLGATPALRESMGAEDIAGHMSLAQPNGITESIGYYGTPIVAAATAAVLPEFGGSATVTATEAPALEVQSVSPPSFISTPGGDVIPIPEGASGPTPVVNGAGNTTGFQYQGGSGGSGMDAKTTGVRVMDPTPARGASPGYPDGYTSYNNASGQTVNPQSGRTVPRSDPSAHMPLTPPQ